MMEGGLEQKHCYFPLSLPGSWLLALENQLGCLFHMGFCSWHRSPAQDGGKRSGAWMPCASPRFGFCLERESSSSWPILEQAEILDILCQIRQETPDGAGARGLTSSGLPSSWWWSCCTVCTVLAVVLSSPISACLLSELGLCSIPQFTGTEVGGAESQGKTRAKKWRNLRCKIEGGPPSQDPPCAYVIKGGLLKFCALGTSL